MEAVLSGKTKRRLGLKKTVERKRWEQGRVDSSLLDVTRKKR